MILGIEMLGATTVLLYGVNLVRDPVLVNYHLGEDPLNPGKPRTRYPYHVRVLVPCYKESLEILRRTVMAAYDATLPAGCQRTIYLCGVLLTAASDFKPLPLTGNHSANAKAFHTEYLSLGWQSLLALPVSDSIIPYPLHNRLCICSSRPLRHEARHGWHLCRILVSEVADVRCADDGKDPKKRKWVSSLNSDVVYVSGRKRPPGEMNGKSGNINNVCSQLYPPGTVVPGNELICIFDADQVQLNSRLASVLSHNSVVSLSCLLGIT